MELKRGEKCPSCGQTVRRQLIEIGNIYYINGGLTKVIIIDDPDQRKPLCKVLNKGIHSKYKIGDKVNITRNYLYSIQGKGPKKYKGRKKD